MQFSVCMTACLSLSPAQAQYVFLHDAILEGVTSELLQVPNDGNGLGKMDQRTKLIDVIEPRYGAYTREGCNACPAS